MRAHMPKASTIEAVIKPIHIDGMAALLTAQNTSMCKLKGEKDTAFVKRIVSTYMNAVNALGMLPPR